MAGAFLRGYNEQAQRDEQAQMSELQRFTGVQGVLAKLAEQQQEQALRQALQSSGGDVDKAMKIMLSSGAYKQAAGLAPLVEAQRKQALDAKFANVGNIGALTADQLEELAARGHPQASVLAGMAKDKRARERDAITLGGMRDTPQGLAAGAMVPGTNQQALFDIPPEERAAFERVTRATALGQPATSDAVTGEVVMGGGALAPLMESKNPMIAGRARLLQQQINNPNFRGNPAEIAKEIDRLIILDAKEPSKGSPDLQGYAKAVEDGFVGSFMDYQKKIAEYRRPQRETPLPMAIADPTSPTGYRWGTRDQALGQPAPAPQSTSLGNFERAVSNDFERHPVVRGYMDLKPDVDVVNNYMLRRPKITSAQRATYDKNLVNTYLKVTHPKGDQISNFERKDLGALPDLPARFTKAIEGFFEGSYVPDDVAAEMANLINEKFTARGRDVANIENKFVEDIKRGGGNPDVIRKVTRGTTPKTDQLSPEEQAELDALRERFGKKP